MKRYIFETATQKVARILARQYNIDVVFEGEQAMTDGKKIYLPYFENLTEELRKDITGYADHEVAHCKFTDFECMNQKKLINRFHKELLNAVEDIRIEREMKIEYPGSSGHLDPLRAKWKKRAQKDWADAPWPMRFMFSTAYEMNGEKLVVDADTKAHLDATKELRAQLSDCTSTSELKNLTGKMVKLVMDKLDEEEKKEEKEGKGKKGGKGKPGEGKDEKSAKGEGESTPGEAAKKMMGEKGDEKNSEWDKHTTDLQDFINEEIKDFVKKGELCPDAEAVPGKRSHDYTFSEKSHVPFSTRFDNEVNQVGKGNPRRYMELRRNVQNTISPTKRSLEQILKIKENAKWTPEQERGSINIKTLSKIAINPAYKTPFRQFTRTETNNVAIELLIDMSGSMAGKMSIAQGTVIAMAEALRDLQIPFEITGFQAKWDRRLSAMTDKIDSDRYNRTRERLEHCIFKGFNDSNLIGLETLAAGRNNVDGESVRWAASRLADQKQKRKILMVFSDGMPAADSDIHVLNSDLKRAVEKIKRSGIECIGFGICTEAVKHFYPEHVVIRNVKDLPGKVMKKLSELIIRGVR